MKKEEVIEVLKEQAKARIASYNDDIEQLLMKTHARADEEEITSIEVLEMEVQRLNHRVATLEENMRSVIEHLKIREIEL